MAFCKQKEIGKFIPHMAESLVIAEYPVVRPELIGGDWGRGGEKNIGEPFWGGREKKKIGGCI